MPVDPLIGSLIQAIVAAAVEHRQAVADRRSIFFADDNGGARLIRDLADPGLPVKFPRRRSYQTIIAAAVTADQARYGVLTLDAEKVVDPESIAWIERRDGQPSDEGYFAAQQPDAAQAADGWK